ncbi:MAG: AAA family ATPase [Deltaproteobacteria bacterium]|nr:AAA family ATPase [Deltaproteobacteria bacterium]
MASIPTSPFPSAFSADPAHPISYPPAAGQEEYGNSSERKLVTVLFSDLTGYSALCERLDPEDVREMMNLVFKEIVGIIIRYEGYIDRIIGDEVLAVFGIPRTHEDDPVRAIRAAVDIHDTVARMTGRFRGRLEGPLAMHSGIATGLVVTGKTDLRTGRHGITGEPVNRASLLTNLAISGEILVGTCTMPSTSGFFFFEKCKYRTGRHRTETIDAYRVLSTVKKPDKIRRVQGLRARLIGRRTQMKDLHTRLSVVAEGRGTCVFLEGDAGTGKSRLISEFKKTLARRHHHWLQGNAYAYTQGIPYFPLIDLLGRAVDLRDDDSQEVVRKKLATELRTTRDDDKAIYQIIERLFTLSNDKSLQISPESWKIKLKQVLVTMIGNQSRTGLTVICIEDLHWADPSTVDLLRNLLNEADLPVFFLISYRPGQLAFNHRQIINPYYQSRCIQLKDLPPEKSKELAKSLLQSEHVPPLLSAFISDQLGGNPFFLEEVINSLVDTGTLKKRGATWEVSGAIGEAVFSSSVAAVIAARLDRLGDAAKRIVQEASVIGRRFAPAVLKQISSDPEGVDNNLAILKSMGLILESDDPGERLCQFKHSLVQEVAYKSLLKRQRRDLHEKIARVLESQNPERIDALCEILAYHFSNGHSLHKAVTYLKQSGRKGLKKYAVTESHNYFEKAYHMLLDGDRLAEDASRRTVELLLEWFFVFNLRGRFEDALNLMKRHESAAMNSPDLHLKGMYLACLGWAYQRREHLTLSRDCLMESLSIGEQIRNYKVIAYSCACLIWTCTDLGRLDEALVFSAKAEEASHFFESEDPSWSFEMDQDLVRFVLTGTAIAQWFKGDCRQCHKLGDRLLFYGENAGDVNSISEGHLAHGMGCFAAGDYRGAIEKCTLAIDSSADPLYGLNARFLMAYSHLSLGEVSPAENNLNALVTFCTASGYEYIGTSADALSSVVAVAKGNFGVGVKAINRHARRYLADGKYYHAQTFHYLLGSIYLRITLREGDLGLLAVVKNLPFFMVHLPWAAKHAEHHFKTAIRMAGQINALGIKGQASFDLARLYQAKNRNDLAVPLFKQSIALFEQLGADGHLERAQAGLNALE